MISLETKIIAALIVIATTAGLVAYVQSLRASLATSEANNATLNAALEQQSRAIESMQSDIKNGRRLSQELNASITKNNRDLQDLRRRLRPRQDPAGNSVDLGSLASKKPALIERSINRGTANAYRCLEIASGAPLTEQEQNAIKPSEINTECPSLANPRYRP